MDGKTYTDASFVSNILSKSGTLTLAITVTDSRGRTATVSEDIAVLAYTAPRISMMKVERCTSDGALSTAGGYLKVTFSASVSSLDSKNVATYKVQYKKSTDTEYAEVELTDYANVYNLSGKTYMFEADKSIVYDVKLIVVDAFDRADKTATGPTSLKLLSILKKRCGLAIGKICEIANAFEVDLVSYFNKTVTFFEQIKIAKGSYVHHTSGTSGEAGYVNIARFTISTTYQNSAICIHTLQRGTKRNMITIRFASVNGTDPDVDVFAHQDTAAYLVKADTSTWDLYIQKTEKYDHICVIQVDKSMHLTGVEIEWKEDQVTTLPDGYITSENENLQKFAINSVAYEVTLTANDYVSPYTYYGSFDVPESDITQYGEPIELTATGSAGVPIPASFETSRRAYRVVSKSETATVRITYLKIS